MDVTSEEKNTYISEDQDSSRIQGSKILKVAIDMQPDSELTNTDEAKPCCTRKSNRPRFQRLNDTDRQIASFVTIKLYGKMAENWISERDENCWTDVNFLQHLFQIRKKYQELRSSCSCLANEKLDEDTDIKSSERDQIREVADGIADLEGAQSASKKESWSTDISKHSESEESREDGSDPDCSMELIAEIVQSGKRRKDVGEKTKRMRRSSAAKKHTCGICQQVLKSSMKRKLHVMSEHCALYIDCKSCPTLPEEMIDLPMKKNNLGAVKLDEYHDHMQKVHAATEAKCPFCNCSKLGNSYEIFRQHMLKKHANDLLCQCLDCAENSKSKNLILIKPVSLKGHMTLKHSVNDQTFGRKIPCELCGMLLAAHSMPRHIKNMHSDRTANQNNLCDICGKYFVHLKQHKYSVHKEKELWMFKCKQCSKRFAKRYNLEVHSRLHTGERPFVCDICGKGFCQNVELRIHTRNNHGNSSKKRKQSRGKEKQLQNETWAVPTVVLPNSEGQPCDINNIQLVESKASPSDKDSEVEHVNVDKNITGGQIVVPSTQDAMNYQLSDMDGQPVYAVIADLPVQQQVSVTGPGIGNLLENYTVINIGGSTSLLKAVTVPMSQFQGAPAAGLEWTEKSDET